MFTLVLIDSVFTASARESALCLFPKPDRTVVYYKPASGYPRAQFVGVDFLSTSQARFEAGAQYVFAIDTRHQLEPEERRIQMNYGLRLLFAAKESGAHVDFNVIDEEGTHTLPL